MTRFQADEAATSLRRAGWPVVYVEINDNGTWRAVAKDHETRNGWLTQLLFVQRPSRH